MSSEIGAPLRARHDDRSARDDAAVGVGAGRVGAVASLRCSNGTGSLIARRG